MNILTGVLKPDRGTISIHGKQVSMRSPGDALNLGIGMIYQHFKLVKPFTVARKISFWDGTSKNSENPRTGKAG